MPFGGLISGAIGGLAGLFGGGNQQKTKTSGTITNNQSGTATGTSSLTGTNTGTSSNQITHNLSPFQKQLASLFTGGATNLYNQAADMSGYRTAGLQQINQGSDLANQVIKNTLASKGLAYSPLATSAETQNQLSRIGQGNQFLSGIPLLQRQLQEQSLGDLMKAFSTLPTDVSQTGTTTGTTNQTGSTTMNTTQQGTQTQQGTNLISGNPLGGLFSGLGAGLLGPSSSGNGGSNLSDILSSLFGGNSGFQLDKTPATGNG